MTFQPILVLITAPTHEDARRINEEKEVLLIVKSREELFEEHLVPAIKAVHPYDVPEIIALPIIMGSKDYLNWIEEVTCE
jgi:periplasmic divalent cation tolerance protein